MGQACCRRPARHDSSYFEDLKSLSLNDVPRQRPVSDRELWHSAPKGLAPLTLEELHNRQTVADREPWVESDDSRMRDALLYEEPPTPVFREDAPGQGLCSPTGCLVRCLTYCCCCSLLLPLVAYLLLIQLNFTVYGTTFTYFSYYRPLWNYILAGMADTASLTQWYGGITNGDPFVGEGPGDNTFMYYGWSEVKALLQDFGPRIRNGTSKRFNELGISIQNGVMWPEVGTIALGYPNVAHSVVRPFLASALDRARKPTEACDGSSCWNAPWLRSVFKERLSAVDTLSSSDLKPILTVILHKVLLNLDISDEDARRFARWMPLFTIPQPLPEAVVTSWPGSWMLGTAGVLDFKAALVEEYKQAIRRKWPSEGWDSRPNDLLLLASAMVDTLALAGGLSVPTTLNFMLALLYMKDSPAAPLLASELVDATVLHDFILETLRRFPPVSGVPHWVTNDKGKTWVRHVPNVGQALQDPRVFPRPLEFVPGRPGLNHQDQTLSIGWADFALVDGDVAHPNSHACPAKQLSIQVLAAFMQEFIAAGPWQAVDTNIKLNMYASSGFKLRKLKPSADQASSVAVRPPSVPFPSAPEPPFLTLCGWMPSACRYVGIDMECMEGPCAYA